MANQDSDLESNVSKRVKMNITMNIELKNSKSVKEYQKIVEAVTKNAMARIDAALAPTNSRNNETATGTKEMAKLRRSLDNKNSKYSKNEKGNATSSNTTSTASSGTKKADASRKEGNVTDIETHKRVETEAMKKVRQSLDLKNFKKNKNDNPNATGSSCSNIAGINKVKYAKDATNTIPKEGKEKPSVETEAMKKIRLCLELKNKSKENNATPSTSGPTNSSCQSVEGIGNTKSPGTGIKRKVADVVTDKTQIETERVKRRKVYSGRNESYSRTTNTTSEITNEQMDIDDDENIAAPSVTGTGSKNTAQLTKRVTAKAGVETEAMKLIRRQLEHKKNKNDVASYSTITSTTGLPRATRVVKENKKVKSPKALKRKTAVDNPTEEMKIMKERIEQRNRKTPQRNETRNTKSTNAKTGHESAPTCNLSRSYTFEMTEDEFDENPAVYSKKNSEMINTDNNKANKRRRSRSGSTFSCLSAMSADNEQADNTAATTIRRITRSRSSKTWSPKFGQNKE